MKKGIIIGKNKSIETYPKDFHKDIFSFGLNHCAIIYNTTKAFTGHDDVLWFYYTKGWGHEKTVVINPLFENRKPANDYSDTLTFAWDFNNICANNFVEVEQLGIDYFVDFAIKGVNIPYPTFRTILHACIFYMLKKKFTDIYLCGCNLTMDTSKEVMSNFNYEKYFWEYAQRHLDRIILAAKKFNVNIYQCKDYEHYKSLRS